MRLLQRIKMVATVVFVVAIALAIVYHQEIGVWLSMQLAESLESQSQQLLR